VERIVAEGVPAYRDTLTCFQAVRAAAGYHEFQRAFRKREALIRPAQITALPVFEGTSAVLTERASKQFLAAYGIPVTREHLAHDADEAASCARAIGFPVALKIESPDIPHKTEAGGVRLNVATEGEVSQAFSEVIEAARRHDPSARIHGVLAQAMAPPGIDMIVRGEPPRDIDALVDCIVRLSWLAADARGRIAQIDVNPLRVFERGVLALDALIVSVEAA
jgi:acyl-CoA synthetase (NDP forming)